jgi:hypothetical protein
LTRGLRKVMERASRTDASGSSRVLLAFAPDSSGHYALARRMILDTLPQGMHVEAVVPKAQALQSAGTEYVYEVDQNGRPRFAGKSPEGRYDLQIVFTVDPRDSGSAALLAALSKVRATESLLLDCNLNTFDRPGFWQYARKVLHRKLAIVRHEPLAAFAILGKFGRLVGRRLMRRDRKPLTP